MGAHPCKECMGFVEADGHNGSWWDTAGQASLYLSAERTSHCDTQSLVLEYARQTFSALPPSTRSNSISNALFEIKSHDKCSPKAETILKSSPEGLIDCGCCL